MVREMRVTLIFLVVGVGVVLPSIAQTARPMVASAPVNFAESIVTVTIDYEAGLIRVSPEGPHVIWYTTDSDAFDPQLPSRIRWIFKGLQKGHFAHIVPKADSHARLFAMPSQVLGRSALTVPSQFNSISSGPVVDFPKATKGESRVSWFYDIVVTDEEGEVVLFLDPETQVQRYP